MVPLRHRQSTASVSMAPLHRLLPCLCVVVSLAVLAPVVLAQPFGDGNFDGAVDQEDFPGFGECISGPDQPPGSGCWAHDFALDVDVDLHDIRDFQRSFGGEAASAQRLMGRWGGSGTTTSGPGAEPFDLILAQRDHHIVGIGWYTEVAGDPLFGWPAVRVVGSINGNDLLLGASGRLDNPCQGDAFIATDNAVITASYNPANGRITLNEIVDYLPVGCERVVESFIVARDDDDFEPGNTDILGTWAGEVVTPPGWLFAPIPIYHPRKSFFPDGPGVEGFLEFTPNGNWGDLVLDWDPASGESSYHWICLGNFTYTGRVEGNKFSGILKWTGDADADFIGVFCHTLQDVVVPPDVIVSCF